MPILNYSKFIKLGTKEIGDGRDCFIVAEIGSNHNQNFSLACKLIDAAAQAGADAVKFQTFKAEQHYSTKSPSFSYLKNVNTHELIKSLELNRSWQEKLKQHAEDQGLIFFYCSYF